MEQLLLGMLQEQLGKYIVGFRKEMVNASLLNGKGEITDLSLNCAAINQQLSNVMPFIELESIHISKVGFQVTSWTNLRKSPIMVDIEHINVHITEPLHYLYPKKRQRIRHMTVSEMEQHFQELQEECRKKKITFHNPNKRGGYSLVDRIVDNLHIEIKSIYIQFQTWGKFKTRRPGPWTPPTLQFKLRNLRYVSVDEYGQEGTPDEVWAHNHRPVPRGQERTLLVFKKVSMEYDFGVQSADGTQHFSLLKGGQGVEPETSATSASPRPTTTTEKEEEQTKEKGAESPTAAEVVAELALGPVEVNGPAPDAAAEMVAALAGESTNSKAMETTQGPGNEEKVTLEAVEKKEEQDSSKEKTLDDNTASPGPQQSEDPMAPQTINGDEKEGDDATKSKKESVTFPENGDKASQENGNKITADSASKTEGAPSSSSPPTEDDQNNNNNYHDGNNQVIVQMAMKRRVRDGALLSAQVDTMLSKVEVLIPAEVVPLLIHAALGIQFCFAKDRGFEDPLRHPDDHTDHNEASARNLHMDDFSSNTENENGDNDQNDKESPSKDAQEGEEKESLQETDPENSKQDIGDGSAAPTSVDAATSDPQAPQAKELAAVTGESISNADTTVTQPEFDGNQEENAAGGEDREIKVPASVLDVLGSEGVGDMSITEDGLSAAGLSALGDTLAEDLADTDTLDDGSTASQLPPAEEGRGFAKSITSLFSRRSVTNLASSEATAAAKEVSSGSAPVTPAKSDDSPPGGVKPVDRAIIMLPNGLVIHEKLSFSVSVDRATVRGVYAPTAASDSSSVEGKENTSSQEASEKYVGEQDRDKDDFIQVDSKGALVEAIWPKTDLKKGGYVQASISYMAVQERHGRRIRTIVSGGVKQDPLAKPIEKSDPPLDDVAKEEAFPLFKDRAIREDPLDLRRSFPAQAVGLLATIDCQTRKKKSPSRTEEELPLPTTITTSKSDNDSTSALPQTSPQVDNNTSQEKEVNAEQEEVVDVLMVTNDLGVDQINLALDCDCWCRALRYFLNESGGGFDGRWFSGDWADLFTIEMMVHPNAPLELEDHLQPLSEFYLDENHFVSSDLLHINAKISNCELRIPAAIEENVRSCDIVVTIDETAMVASSDLPREFLSANIGSTFCQQENHPSDLQKEVKFPNDLSDVSVELQNSEDPSKRQSYMVATKTNALVKAKSVFRLDVKLLGMCTQIIPVIPFVVSSQPRLLCSPTDMTIGFCFEGEPPESEDSNEIKMVLYSSLVIDHIETNLDLDLLAGAVSTILHHAYVVKETIACAKQLIPMHANEDESSVASVSSEHEKDDDLSTAASARIVKSLRGHHILVRRQLHRSRETGGLQFASFIQVANYGFTLWRHNVAVYSPVHSAGGVVANVVERQKLHFPLLKLLSFGAKNVEVGMELSFPDDERRVVLKCGVEEARLRLCKLKVGAASESIDTRQPSTDTGEPKNKVSVEEDEEMKMPAEEQGHSSEEDTGSDSRYDMVDILHVGRNVPLPPVHKADNDTVIPRQQAILLRCEEYYSGVRSRSLVAEVGTGGTATLCIDQIESVFVLVLEALIMPTWSKQIKFPLIEKRRFPERTVGALLHSLLPGPGGRFRFWRFLRKIIALLLPEDLRLLLLRVRADEMLVTIPTVKGLQDIDSECQKCELMLRYLDLVTWYVSSEKHFHDNILSVAAMEGKPWSSLVSTASTGINHRLSCRQSFHLTGNSNLTTQEVTPNEILPEFGVSLEYLHAKLSVSMDNTLSLYETEQLRDCLRFLAHFGKRCIDIFFHLRRRLTFLKRRGCIDEEVEEQGEDEKDSYQPINAACADMEKSVRTAKDFVLRMGRYFDDSIRDHDAALRQKDDEVERLQRLVFLKEKERVAAVTMASSPIAGWLRVGGTHQTGMRVASTSTLWRYWAVLRRDMLILYSAPGKYKPVDLVLLRGAQLRVLAGGKSKWDLKRAFGLVESEGKTRFFVAESEVEYTGWTREIGKITRFHSAAVNEREMKTVASGGAEIDSEPIPNNASSDRDEESVGLESAGPKTTDSVMSEQEATGTEQTPKQGFRGKLANLGSSLKLGSSENKSASAGANTEEAKSINPTEDSVSEGISPQPSENVESPNVNSVSRRLQFGKVAGVGRAFMAVTKKTGREVAERTRRAATPGSSSKDDKVNTSSHNSLHVISERDGGEKNWTCPKCTYINKTKETDVDVLVCAVCESLSDAGEVEFEHLPDEGATKAQDVTNASSEVLLMAETEEDANQELLGSTASDQSVFRRSQSTPIEQRDRLNSADSDADLLRRSQSSGSVGGLTTEEDETSIISDLALDEISEASRSGGRRSSRGRLGGLGVSLGSAARRNRQARPPEPEKKQGWFARLGSSVSNQEEPDGFQKSQPALKLKNIQIDPSIDFVSNAPGSFVAPLRKLEGQWFVTICDCSEKAAEGYLEWIHKDGDGSSVVLTPPQAGAEDVAGQVDSEANKSTRSQQASEHLFCIQIFNGSSNDANSKHPNSQVIRSFSDVVSFHVEMSEIIEELMHHPLFLERSLERTATGDMTPGLHNSMGISALDYIRITGAFLAGLADARSSSSSPVEIPLSRQAEVLVDFLNAMLECPLSSAGHFALKDFLSIQDFASSEVWSAPVDDGDQNDEAVPTEDEHMEPPRKDDDETPSVGHESTQQNQTSSTMVKQKKANVLMELSTSCMEELVIAEQNGRLATNLLGALPTANSNWLYEITGQQPSYLEPLLPNHVTENLQEAMHSALMKVMAERDEAHAQLVSASVLHAHTIEQERKKVDRLSAKLELANKLQLNNTTRGPLFGGVIGERRNKAQEVEKEEREKLHKKEQEMQQNSDAEIVALCEQLSGEISTRTQAALEVIRLKESRALERQHEAEEKEALRDELTRLKERLAYEELKTEEARREAQQWKQYYERATASKEGGRSDSQPTP